MRLRDCSDHQHLHDIHARHVEANSLRRGQREAEARRRAEQEAAKAAAKASAA